MRAMVRVVAPSAPRTVAPRTSQWRAHGRVGAAIVGVAVLAAVVGPWLSPFDPAAQELALRLEGPTVTHWFGLDELGRDIFARVLSGARISLMVGLVVVSVSATVGIALGSVAGYFGGRVDEAISRLIDILLAFPGLLLAIALVAVLGPSLTNVVLALSLIGWVGYARLVRGQVLRARELEFVQAARALGATTVADPDAPRHSHDAAGGHACRRRSGWGARFSRRRRSAFSGWASSRRRRAGGRC